MRAMSIVFSEYLADRGVDISTMGQKDLQTAMEWFTGGYLKGMNETLLDRREEGMIRSAECGFRSAE